MKDEGRKRKERIDHSIGNRREETAQDESGRAHLEFESLKLARNQDRESSSNRAG
jgi:hypothetical protein